MSKFSVSNALDKSINLYVQFSNCGRPIIKYYTRQNSPVYTCFLDASKAFDRINHWTLFKKLIDCNVPLLIVRILVFWYQM